MVAAITMLTDSFCSSSFFVVLNSHALTSSPKLQSPVSLRATPTTHPRQWFSLMNFDTTSTTQVRRLTCPNLGNRFLIQCNCLDRPTTQFETGMLFSFFREIGLSEKETDSLLDKNPTLRSTSLDRLRARVLALQSVGINDFALNRLVIKYPIVLIAEEIDSVISFVRDDLEGKVKPSQLVRLFSTTETRFWLGFDEKVNLLLHHEILREKIAHVLNNVNLIRAICGKSVEEIERTIAFLKSYHNGIEVIVRRPAILNYYLDSQLMPKIQFLEELSGGDKEATGTLLRKLPAILSYRLEHMEGHVEFLRSYAGLSDPEIFKIFLVFPNVISTSKERKLRPRVEFLKQCGLNSSDMFKFLTRAPLFLALSFEDNLVYKLGFLVKIGYEYRTKELAVALGAVTRTSCENMQKVIGLFLSYGLSCEDIFAMSKKHPQILQYNPRSLEEKVEYLIEGMGREVSELLIFPAFLGYKLDDRIKHRYEVKKKTIGEGMNLNKLLSVSANRFSTKRKPKKVLLTTNNQNKD